MSQPEKKIDEIVEEFINKHYIAVFSKSYCPYCKKAKETLKALNKDDKLYGVMELDGLDDETCQAIQDYLLQKTGERTVPRIFINKKSIGGNSDLEKKKQEVIALLQDSSQDTA